MNTTDAESTTPNALPDTLDALFSRRAGWQAWLDVEAALARAQAELGLVPADAAAVIADCARIDRLDETALAADMARTLSPVMSLVRALAARIGEPAGGYVHYGATTQNIIVAGKMCQLHRAHRLLLARLAEHLVGLADLAEDTADWACVARTNRRQALPITFGYRVAGWIEEAERHIDRLEACARRCFVLTFGGAGGAMHGLGAQGQPLAEAVAQRLGLGVSRVHSRAAVDGLVEYITMLGLWAAGVERLGETLYTLMGNEFAEVSERQDDTVVGSSTMPHKFNPKYVVELLVAAGELRSLVPGALELARPSHDGDAASNFRLYDLIDRAAPLAYRTACALSCLLERLVVDRTALAAPLTRHGAELMSEQVMLAISASVGRQAAHDHLHRAIHDARVRHISLHERLAEDDLIRRHFPERTALAAALDPLAHTGQSAPIARALAASARERAARLTRAIKDTH